MKEARIYVDFNEMIECDLVLLSKTDFKKDSDGNTIEFKEGKKIKIYMDDENDLGEQDNLIANGKVELNISGLFPVCKWNCRIDENGIRNESELQ